MRLGIIELVVLLYIAGNPGSTREDIVTLLKTPLGITEEGLFDVMLVSFLMQKLAKCTEEKWETTSKGLESVKTHPLLAAIIYWKENMS